MAKSRNQKGKILVIEHLLQGTGESRIVTMLKSLINFWNMESLQRERVSMMI